MADAWATKISGDEKALAAAHLSQLVFHPRRIGDDVQEVFFEAKSTEARAAVDASLAALGIKDVKISYDPAFDPAGRPSDVSAQGVFVNSLEGRYYFNKKGIEALVNGGVTNPLVSVAAKNLGIVVSAGMSAAS